ncbi:hypothetical protein [Bacillus solimangrovi]|uniref:Uncharacterized protein n=1 Tax=Bacillus solimangrovi TaxID=1305675 RepID=A0A1E5LEM7_9BACI|nr:hypothetical protein [Bacillus solimangrovi]OEH92536.1 hypothetical protein BFG57_15485 [Bacillus solimangrovi]
MKKILLSLLGGSIVGGIICYIFLDYQNSNYIIRHYYGSPTFEVRELDYDYLFNATVIIVFSSILISLIWSFFEKKSGK